MDVVNASCLGQNIRHYRLLKNWSQTDLHWESRVPQAMISRIENGQRQDMHSRHALRMAQALGVTVEDLWSEREE